MGWDRSTTVDEVAELIDPDDLVDARQVAELLGLASENVISVYRSRYADFPEPAVERGRCRLWLRSDVLGWSRPSRTTD